MATLPQLDGGSLLRRTWLQVNKLYIMRSIQNLLSKIRSRQGGWPLEKTIRTSLTETRC